VRRRLASPRFRRRLFWGGGSILVVGSVVATAIMVGNTGHSTATPIDHSKPAQVYIAPTAMHLTKHDRVELFIVADKFVRTAVVRKHLDSAWNLLGPEMKAGQTRKSWDTGYNNVVPFPADGIQSFSINYAYENDVAVDLSLFHRGTGSNWSGKTFTLELKRDVSRPGRPWLVAAWVPKGIGGGGSLNPSRRAGPPPERPKARISSRWLFFPAAFLVVLLLVIGSWALNNAIRGRRVSRRYAEALGYRSTTKPS